MASTSKGRRRRGGGSSTEASATGGTRLVKQGYLEMSADPARVCFVFGAGASVDFGAPVMPDFWGCAERLANDHVEVRTELDMVRDWRHRKLRQGALQQAQRGACDRRDAPDAENVEDLLSLAYADATFRDSAAQAVADALVELASLVYDLAPAGECIASHQRWQSGAPPLKGYEVLLSRLRDVEIDDEPLWTSGCSFITTDYDVALDGVVARASHDYLVRLGDLDDLVPDHKAVLRGEAWPLYWLGRADDDERETLSPRLLKLHGSVNWGVCTDPECDAPIRQFPFVSYVRAEAMIVPLANSLHGTRCSYHPPRADGRDRVHRCYLIPPSWKSGAFRYGLRRVWSKASEDLATAQRVVIIGHSLPPSDTYLQYFLRLSLAGRPDCEVLVVNPAGRDIERYHTFLRQFLPGQVTCDQRPFADSIDAILQFIDS